MPDTVLSTGYLSGTGLVEVQNQLRLEPGQTLVEVGCGRAGYGLDSIAASGARLVGVDFSAQALRSASTSAARLGLDKRAQFQLGDLTASGLAAGMADAVLCVDAIHFAESVVAAAAECRRMLGDGGRVVITTWEPSNAEAAARLPERIRRMNIGRDLAQVGFVDVEVMHRPDWDAAEAAFWARAVGLDPAGDPAIAALREEAVELLPLADTLCRFIAVARKGERR